MKNRFSISALLAILAIPAISFAQGVRYDDVALLDTGRPVQGATITVCASGSTGTPCTPTASIFSDSTLSTPITQPGFQSGAQGNFFFYAACGKYDISITGNGITGRTKKDVQLGPCGNFNSAGAAPTTVKSLQVTSLASAQRLFINQGSTLTSGRFTLSAGWGTTASISSVAGTDEAFTFTVSSSGTGQASNPTITVAYADGTWTNVPVCIAFPVQASTSIMTGLFQNSATNSSQLVIGASGFTPTAGQTYSLSVMCIGK
jgi:hypothetical protein